MDSAGIRRRGRWDPPAWSVARPTHGVADSRAAAVVAAAAAPPRDWGGAAATRGVAAVPPPPPPPPPPNETGAPSSAAAAAAPRATGAAVAPSPLAATRARAPTATTAARPPPPPPPPPRRHSAASVRARGASLHALRGARRAVWRAHPDRVHRLRRRLCVGAPVGARRGGRRVGDDRTDAVRRGGDGGGGGADARRRATRRGAAVVCAPRCRPTRIDCPRSAPSLRLHSPLCITLYGVALWLSGRVARITSAAPDSSHGLGNNFIHDEATS